MSVSVRWMISLLSTQRRVGVKQHADHLARILRAQANHSQCVRSPCRCLRFESGLNERSLSSTHSGPQGKSELCVSRGQQTRHHDASASGGLHPQRVECLCGASLLGDNRGCSAVAIRGMRATWLGFCVAEEIGAEHLDPIPLLIIVTDACHQRIAVTRPRQFQRRQKISPYHCLRIVVKGNRFS